MRETPNNTNYRINFVGIYEAIRDWKKYYVKIAEVFRKIKRRIT